MGRGTSLLLAVTLLAFGIVSPTPAHASVPYCGGISQPDIPTASQTADGRASFTWPSVYSGVEYKYSFTGWTGTDWTPWTNWASAGSSTSVVIPFEVYGQRVISLSFIVIAQCWDYGPGRIAPKGEARIEYTPPASPPESPQVAMSGSTATVYVRPSAANAREVITEYRVVSSPQGQECTVSGSAIDKKCVISDLSPGIGYSFVTYATNALGTSSASGSSSQVFVPTLPGPPRSVRADVGKGKATVVWLPPSDDGHDPITRYVVVSSPDRRTCETNGALTCRVKGLANGKSYSFTVTAVNGIGASPASAPSSKIKLMALPTAPVRVTAVRNGSSITVKWKKPKSTGGSAIRNYVVSATTSSERCRTRKRSCKFSGLEVGRTYAFTIQARNRTGLSPSARTQSISIPVPPKAQQDFS